MNRSHLELISELPWEDPKPSNIDLAKARKILDDVSCWGLCFSMGLFVRGGLHRLWLTGSACAQPQIQRARYAPSSDTVTPLLYVIGCRIILVLRT